MQCRKVHRLSASRHLFSKKVVFYLIINELQRNEIKMLHVT